MGDSHKETVPNYTVFEENPHPGRLATGDVPLDRLKGLNQVEGQRLLLTRIQELEKSCAFQVNEKRRLQEELMEAREELADLKRSMFLPPPAPGVIHQDAVSPYARVSETKAPSWLGDPEREVISFQKKNTVVELARAVGEVAELSDEWIQLVRYALDLPEEEVRAMIDLLRVDALGEKEEVVLHNMVVAFFDELEFPDGIELPLDFVPLLKLFLRRCT